MCIKWLMRDWIVRDFLRLSLLIHSLHEVTNEVTHSLTQSLASSHGSYSISEGWQRMSSTSVSISQWTYQGRNASSCTLLQRQSCLAELDDVLWELGTRQELNKLRHVAHCSLDGLQYTGLYITYSGLHRLCIYLQVSSFPQSTA